MSNPLLIRIGISPENLQKLNRGEKVVWAGVAHPELTIELVPLANTNVVEDKKPDGIQMQVAL